MTKRGMKQKAPRGVNGGTLADDDFYAPDDPKAQWNTEELVTRMFAFDKSMRVVRPEMFERAERMRSERRARGEKHGVDGKPKGGVSQ